MAGGDRISIGGFDEFNSQPCDSSTADSSKAGLTFGSSQFHDLVPADLPSNIPDPNKYPMSRYGGLHRFVQLLPPIVQWEFIGKLGGRIDETPTGEFWAGSFSTNVVLMAYLALKTMHRAYFLQSVVWIRDPLPGRPGGVQIPPPEWPGNLPTPIHHVMTRYAGLADWVKALTDDWAEAARMALFGIHERFDDVWWSDYQKTVDMYRLYSQLSPALRNTFEESVYWIPDGPKPNGSHTGKVNHVGPFDIVEGDKFCYLQLFRPEKRDSVRERLGRNPWASEVAAELLRGPGVWQPGTFALTIGSKESSDGQAYLQGHVEPSVHGTSIRNIIPYLSGAMRLGATSDINALANLQLQDDVTARPTLFPTRQVGGGPGLEMVYNVYFQLTKTEGVLTWIPMDHAVFSWLLGAFESVRILGASFNVQISTGAQNSLLCAICGPTVDLAVPSDWYATPVNTEIHGSDQGYVTSVFELPQLHSFDPEIRSPDSIGNPTPSFRFSFSAVTGARAMIKGMIRVKVNGQATLGHIDIGPKAPKKSAARMREAIVEALPYDVDGTTKCDVDEEEEDSDDEAPVSSRPLRVSPPRANTSSGRTA